MPLVYMDPGFVEPYADDLYFIPVLPADVDVWSWLRLFMVV